MTAIRRLPSLPRVSTEQLWSALGLPAVTLAMVLYFASQSPNFLTVGNAQNLGRNMAALAVLAIGQAFVIVLGEIDISQGAIVGLATIMAALAMQDVGAIGMLAAPLIGLTVGLVNGLLVASFFVHSVIITIGTLTTVRGIAFELSGGQPVTGDFSEAFTWIGTGFVGPFPAPFVIALGVCVIAILVVRFTRFGPWLYATGGNEEASRLAGLPVTRLKIAAFGISGLMAGIAGLILAARIESGQPNLGAGLELQAIAAAVIGGMALAGGRGALAGVLLGVVVLTVLQNGLDITNVSSFTQQIISGLIIILAVVVDQLRGGGVLARWRRRPGRARVPTGPTTGPADKK